MTVVNLGNNQKTFSKKDILLSKNVVLYLQKTLSFLIKHGKKSNVERNLYTYFKNTNLNIKDIEDKVAQIMYKTVLYINLKTRRRGRRVFYKVEKISKVKAEKKSLFSFSKNLRERQKEKFYLRFEKEMDKILNDKNVKLEKRNEIHQKALKYIRYPKVKKKVHGNGKVKQLFGRVPGMVKSPKRSKVILR